MFGIAALGMSDRMPGIALPIGFLNARGVGIGNDRMSGIAALEMPECPA